MDVCRRYGDDVTLMTHVWSALRNANLGMSKCLHPCVPFLLDHYSPALMGVRCGHRIADEQNQRLFSDTHRSFATAMDVCRRVQYSPQVLEHVWYALPLVASCESAASCHAYEDRCNLLTLHSLNSCASCIRELGCLC